MYVCMSIIHIYVCIIDDTLYCYIVIILSIFRQVEASYSDTGLHGMMTCVRLYNATVDVSLVEEQWLQCPHVW